METNLELMKDFGESVGPEIHPNALKNVIKAATSVYTLPDDFVLSLSVLKDITAEEHPGQTEFHGPSAGLGGFRTVASRGH